MNLSRILTPRSAACALCLSAAAPALGAVDPFEDPDQAGWFVRFGGRVSMGVKAQIRDTQAAPVSVAGAYDNGYVKPDAGGSATSTWNWGYNTASQIQAGNLVLQRIDGTPRVGGIDALKDDPHWGGELIAGFEFARFNIGKREAKFGFEAGYSYSTLSSSQHAMATGTAVQTVDQFSLGGVIPPLAPYQGTFAGPGPLLSLNPSAHATTSSAATATLDSRLQTDFHTFRVGPWIEVPLSGRMSLGLSAGYATVYTGSSWDITESLAFANAALPAPTSVSIHTNGAHWSPGAFAQARLQYRLTRHVGLYVGADMQYSTSSSVIAPGREVRFNLGTSYGGVAGVSLNF